MRSKKIELKYLINFDNYISKRDSTLLFLMTILAVIPTLLSGNQNSNLWERLINTIQSPLANVMFFSGLIIIMLSVKKHICYNELFFSRFSNCRELIIYGLWTIAVATTIFYIVFVLLALAGATFFSFGNYDFGIYEKYNMSMAIYIFFTIIKNIIIYVTLSIILFLFSNLIRKKIIKYFLLFLMVGFYFFPYENKIVCHFYQIPLFFQAHILGTNFKAFYTESIIFFIYIFILCLVSIILFNYCTKRKFTLQ